MKTSGKFGEPWELGVFTSIDAGFGVQLEVASELKVPTMHLHAPHKKKRTPEIARKFRQRLESLAMRITVVFAGFEGESYADIPTVISTVGLVPQATRESRLIEIKEIVNFTSLLGVDATGLHLGFVPHDATSADYAAIVEVTRSVCDYAAELGVHIHLETGQEPAEVLLGFLTAVDRSNLFINFDPANMILYGCGEPLAALRKLASYVRSVHCKDATWSAQPGVTWGKEVPLGKGDVNFEDYLATLHQIGYQGPLTIEREISQEPERQKREILAASSLLTQLKSSRLKQHAMKQQKANDNS